MSFTHIAAGITAVGTTPTAVIPSANLYLLQINAVGSITTSVSPEFSLDGTNWWSPATINNISSNADVIVYQLTQMPSLRMRLNVTAIDTGVTIDAWVSSF
jgi:hypothetical protein